MFTRSIFREVWLRHRLAGLVLGLLLVHDSWLSAQDLPGDGVATLSNPRADQAVRRALDYLKASQKDDGAWESGHYGKMTSVTSLAVLAFLANGHVPGE